MHRVKHKYLAKTRVISDETTNAPSYVSAVSRRFKPGTEIKHILFFFFLSLCHLHRIRRRARSNKRATCFPMRITTPRMIYACTEHKSSSATIGAEYAKSTSTKTWGWSAAGVQKQKIHVTKEEEFTENNPLDIYCFINFSPRAMTHLHRQSGPFLPREP